MHNAWRAGDFAAAERINELLAPLHDALFAETSPGPVKYAASLLGLSTPDLRLPLVGPGDATKVLVTAAMQRAGLLK